MGHKSLTPIKDRFWNKVDIAGPDDCWIWKGGHTSGGDKRGAFEVDGSVKSASRVAYMFHNNIEILGRWEFVCHTCDNGNCCNPAHLYLGGIVENARDRKARRRGAYYSRKPGEPRNKLTMLQVFEIRSKYAPLIYTQLMLAKEYKVSVITIGHIIHRRTWKDIL